MQRVIWKVKSDVIGDFHSADLSPFPTSPEETSLFSDVSLEAAPTQVFSLPPVALRAEILALPHAFHQDPVNDLAGYYHAFVEDEEADKLIERLRNENDVEEVERQPRLERPYRVDSNRNQRCAPPAVFPNIGLQPIPTLDYESLQGYLDPAPGGIDARFAWTLPGGRGGGVNIVDIEFGWNFQHEDLRKKQIGIVFGDKSDHDHGTAVLGILGGDQNGFGVTGIAADAISSAAAADFGATEQDPFGRWNAAEAIRAMADSLRPGDVILLEMHAPGPNSPGPNEQQVGYIPVEYWTVEFAAIQYATAKGIHVVEAGGNGGDDLDQAVYDNRFNREYRDSGAILVGGGASALQDAPRSRIVWSNYGSRFDLQGWGEDIVTCGGLSDVNDGGYYSDLRRDVLASRCYTQTFNGTSGASPIVAGAVAVINGCLRAVGRPVLTPDLMRQLLVETGTQQTDGPDGLASEQIGPLPNLRRALETLGLV